SFGPGPKGPGSPRLSQSRSVRRGNGRAVELLDEVPDLAAPAAGAGALPRRHVDVNEVALLAAGRARPRPAEPRLRDFDGFPHREIRTIASRTTEHDRS